MLYFWEKYAEGEWGICLPHYVAYSLNSLTFCFPSHTFWNGLLGVAVLMCVVTFPLSTSYLSVETFTRSSLEIYMVSLRFSPNSCPFNDSLHVSIITGTFPSWWAIVEFLQKTNVSCLYCSCVFHVAVHWIWQFSAGKALAYIESWYNENVRLLQCFLKVIELECNLLNKFIVILRWD